MICNGVGRASFLVCILSLMLTVVVSWGAQRTKKSKYTVDQIEELIKSEAPVMANKDDVIAFLDARNISHSKYKEHKGTIQPEFETDFQDAKIKGNAHLIKYFVFATVPSAGKWSIFRVDIHLTFFFDAEGNLVEYLVREVEDGP
jgi:hypothetical protein